VTYNAGTAHLQIVPSFRGIEDELARFSRSLGQKIAKSLDGTLAPGLADAVRQATDDVRLDVDKAGRKTAGVLADALRRRTEAAFKAIPGVEITADSSDADREVDAIRRELAELHDQRIGIDIDEVAAMAKLLQLEHRLKQITAGNYSVEMNAGTDAARAQLAGFFEDVKTEQQKAADAAAKQAAADAAKAAQRAREAAQRAAEQQQKDAKRAAEKAADDAQRDAEKAAQKAADAYARTFAGQMQTAMRQATTRIPDVQLGVDASDGEKALAQIRAELAALSRARIGVDIDEATALAAIAFLKQRLEDLSHSDPNVAVRVDAAAGAAELTAVMALVSRVDGDDVNIDVNVDTDRGIAGLTSLSDATQVNMSRLAALIALGASLGTAIVPAAAAAASAIGFIGTAAAASVTGVGVLVLGFSGISDAVTALGQQADQTTSSQASLSRASSQVATATDAITSAERQLRSVRAQNADAARRADQEVEQAEISLGQAQLAERRVQADLTQAREEARRALHDMALAVEDNALRQRQATLDVADAKEKLDTLLANPRATDQEREQAQVTYEQALHQQKQLGIEAQRLAADQQAAAKKGVDGSEQVTAAQDRITAATRQVADAQRRLADAVAAQTSQQRQAADALAGAQQQVVSAQRSLQRAYTSAGTAGGASINNVRTAMAKLSPVGREFATFIFGLRDELFDVRAAAADGLLSGVQDAIEQVLPVLPPLIRFVGDVSDELGSLARQSVKEFKDPTWQRLFTYIAQTAVPTIEQLFRIGANLAKGTAGLFLAFTPLTGDVADGILKVSQRFADWATTLGKNPQFQQFLAYVRDAAPDVINLLKQVAVFGVKLAQAAAPTGEVVIQIFTQLFTWLNKIPTNVLKVLVGAIAGIAAGLSVLSAVTAAFALGWAGVIVGGIAAIVAGAAILYQTVAPFRAFVDSLFQSLGQAVQFWWQYVLSPTLSALGAAVQWLWTSVLYPFGQVVSTAFGLISQVVSYFWGNVGQPVFAAIGWYLSQIVAPVVTWLYAEVIKPVFGLIEIAFNALGAVFQVMAGILQIGMKALAALFWALWDTSVQPVWQKVRPFFEFLRDFLVTQVVPKLKLGMSVIAAVLAVLVDAAKEPIEFIVNTIFNGGLLAGYNKLAKMFGVKPDDVHIDLPASWDDTIAPIKFARGGILDGGVLPGYTPGRDVHSFVSPSGGRLELSGGEAILRPETTAVLGPAWVDGINQAARTGGIAGVHRYLTTIAASGDGYGERGDGLGDLLDAAEDTIGGVLSSGARLFADPAGTLLRLTQDLLQLVPGADSMIGKAVVAGPAHLADNLGDLLARMFTGNNNAARSSGGIGSAPMMNILHGPFPGLPMFSGYRPGAITVTGHRSYHGMIAANGEKGRAVDVPPNMAVFDWLHEHYPDSRELIYTPAGSRQIHDGQPHVYSSAVAAEHYNHVHWAMANGGILPTLYDQGGYLPPGLSVVANGTGRPEPVFTDAQWQQLREHTTRGADQGGNQYHFQFSDTTLTPAKLRALQDREDARNRAHRPR